MLHVVCDTRGTWRVFVDTQAAPLSEHDTATEAELAAWRHARARGADAILVHDRYGRTRPPTTYRNAAAESPAAAIRRRLRTS
jgi:hypothetical protein